MPARSLKRLRQGLKRPFQTAFAWAVTLPLDRGSRSLGDLDGVAPRRIVASRTDRIGDLLCCTPLLWALHQRWPDARLVVIPGRKNQAVLTGLPFVEPGPVFRRDPASWWRLAWWLARGPFDLAVSLRAESMAGVWVSAWSRAPVRMVTHATYAAPAANLVLGVADTHQTTRYWRAARLLGAAPEEVRPIFVVGADAERRGAELAARLGQGGGRLIGLQIPHRGSRRHAVRAWPVENVIALTRALVADGCRVVLCGTGAERVEAELVRSQVPEVALMPPAPLAVFAAVQRRFGLFIAQYTGTLHLADAVGTPTVGYGLTSQVEGWGVIGPRHRSIGARSVPAIGVDALLAAARSVLAGEARAG